MKLLFLAPHPFYQERGTPIAVDLLLHVLVEKGVDVDLLTYHEGEDRHYTGPGSVTIHRIPTPPCCKGIRPGFSLKKLWADVFFYRSAVKLVRTYTYDALHAVEEAVFMARRLGRKASLPYVYDMDSSMSRQILDKLPFTKPLASLMQGREATALREAAAVAAVCDDLADIAREAGADPVFLLRDVPLLGDASPCGTDLRNELGGRGPMMLYVGNLEAYQGMDLLLESVAWMKGAPEAHLVIVGGNEHHIAHYRRRAEELGIGEITFFTGPRPLEELGGLLRQADVLVSPRSQGTNTPMKIYSYMASGTAIAATDRLTHTQVLTSDTAALASPVPEEYGAGLQELLKSPEQRQKIAEAARQEVDTKYSMKKFKETVDHILQAVSDKTAAK